MNQERDFLSTPELAKLLGISRSSAYKLVNDRRFYPAFRIGRRLVISAEALKRWTGERTGSSI